MPQMYPSGLAAVLAARLSSVCRAVGCCPPLPSGPSSSRPPCGGADCGRTARPCSLLGSFISMSRPSDTSPPLGAPLDPPAPLPCPPPCREGARRARRAATVPKSLLSSSLSATPPPPPPPARTTPRGATGGARRGAAPPLAEALPSLSTLPPCSARRASAAP